MIVASACVGGHDEVRAVAPIPGVEMRMYSDRDIEAPGWDVHHLEWPEMHGDRLLAKLPKVAPHLLGMRGVVVWVDASMSLAEGWLDRALEHFDPDAEFPWLMHRHRVRQCIGREALASAPMPKYAGVEVIAQAEGYFKRGMPRSWGLWETGFIIRDVSHPMVWNVGDKWLWEIRRRGTQDQISLPWSLWWHGVRPQEFPDPMPWDGEPGPLFTIHPHRRVT